VLFDQPQRRVQSDAPVFDRVVEQRGRGLRVGPVGRRVGNAVEIASRVFGCARQMALAHGRVRLQASGQPFEFGQVFEVHAGDVRRYMIEL